MIADLHERVEEAERVRAALERERLEVAAHERRMVLEAARNEAAKMRDLEGRFEEMQKRWQERADATVAKIAETAERRKAVDEAQRQTAKVRREMREDWERLVPVSGAPSAAPKLKIEEGVRVRVKGIRDLARVRRVLGKRALRSGSRFHEDADFGGGCGRGFS